MTGSELRDSDGNAKRAVADIARKVEDQAASLGWDQPATLFEIDGEVDDEVRPVSADGESTVLFAASVRLIDVLDGTPRDALVGRHCGEAAFGAAIVAEAWGRPAETGELTDDDRFEMRLCQVLFRDGTEAMVVRTRGEEPEVFSPGGAVTFDGALTQALHRYLRCPSGAQPELDIADTVGAYLAVSHNAVVAAAATPGFEAFAASTAENMMANDPASLSGAVTAIMLLALTRELAGPAVVAATAAEIGGTWDDIYPEALDALARMRKAAAGEPVEADIVEFEGMAEWADPPMLAAKVIDRLGGGEQALKLIEKLSEAVSPLPDLATWTSQAIDAHRRRLAG